MGTLNLNNVHVDKAEIIRIAETLPRADMQRPMPSTAWKLLFEFYNSFIDTHRALSMSCRPCYYKVYEFCTQVVLEAAIPFLKSENE
jgi:hypothetical protein